jgi:magnesium-transporting ATPase (P-type)
VLVKKLESVEALGAVEYVIFDKTGTLTQGTLSLAYVSERLKPWLGYFAIADSKDPVEKVLQQFEVKAGTLVEVKPFNYETRTSAVVWKLGDKSKEFVKGAPEVIFSLCGVKDEKAEALAKEGMRALAFAVREGERWEYLGLVGFEDPLKDTAKRALTEMKESGLVPIMITGDHKETARAIAKQVGIRCVLVSGEEVRKRPKRAIKKILKGGVVYRAKPEDKLLVVEELQTKGFITAATGMFAFASATQGWVLTKTSGIERLLLLAVVPFMLIPNMTSMWLGIGSEYLSYAIGFAIYGLVYFMQKNKVKD